MNSKVFISVCFFFLLAFTGMAQEVEQEPEAPRERAPWRDKVFFGAGGGLQISNIATFITVMPSVGYRITPKWSSGVMGAYQYVKFRDLNRSAHNYGGSLFTRYVVFKSAYVTAEYEQMNLEFTGLNRERERRWVDRMLVGAGFIQQGPGGRGGLHIGILYDLFYTNGNNYPYQSPFVYRVGLIF